MKCEGCGYCPEGEYDTKIAKPNESSSKSCCGDEDLFKCNHCGSDWFTYKNNSMYCKCGTVYDLSNGKQPTQATG